MRLCFTGPHNQHTWRWVNAFAQRGHEVHLILDDPANSDQVIVHSLNLIQKKSPRYFLKKLSRLRRLLKEINPDLLHTHYVTGEGYLGALSGFHPYVVTIWGNDIYIRPHTGLDERLFTMYTLKRADLITADSQDQIEAAVRLGAPRSKIALIQWGVNLKMFHPDRPTDVRTRLGIGEAPVVISQRSCLPLYNIDILTAAFADTLRVVPEAHLIITGGGSLREDIIAASEIKTLVHQFGIDDHVHFTGYLPYDELPAYIVAADVTVSVPSSDGTAMSLLEGMACGVAPIVSDLPSNREWITDGVNGAIVPIRDRAALAARLIELLQDQERRQTFAAHNRRLIWERANHDMNMDRMEELYHDLIQRAAPRRRLVPRSAVTRVHEIQQEKHFALRMLKNPRYVVRMCAASLREYMHLPSLLGDDNDVHIREAARWLVRAQTVHGDGGCAKCFNVLTNTWEASYPETSGYIIPSFFWLAQYYEDDSYRRRAEEIGSWLLTLQLETGAFPWIDRRTPLVFDTGQVLHGLLSLWETTRDAESLRAIDRAAAWLTGGQEEDGSWVRDEYGNRPHTYNTQVAWALARTWQVTGQSAYRTAATRQLDWALARQKPNGWFHQNSLDDDERPILHTIVYAAQGFLESGLILGEERYLDAARSTAQALAEHYQAKGRLFGAYDERWRGVVLSRCLVGEAQLAGLWLRLTEVDGDSSYQRLAAVVNLNLKRVHHVSITNLDIRGGIQGSFPIYGRYMPFKFPNWAAKYFIDSLLLEEKLLRFAQPPPEREKREQHESSHLSGR